jgi:hypothetical protein
MAVVEASVDTPNAMQANRERMVTSMRDSALPLAD